MILARAAWGITNVMGVRCDRGGDVDVNGCNGKMKKARQRAIDSFWVHLPVHYRPMKTLGWKDAGFPGQSGEVWDGGGDADGNGDEKRKTKSN